MPTKSVGSTPHLDAMQGDTWQDTTNMQIFSHNGSTFVPVTAPALPGLMTGSLAAGGLQGLFYMPATTVTLGGTWTVPAGYVGMVYDMTHHRLCIVASGGSTIKTVALT